MMAAIYVTYAAMDYSVFDCGSIPPKLKQYKAGDVVAYEVKLSGMAPKVADRTRSTWQSVVRYSVKTPDEMANTGLISYAKVVGRDLYVGNELLFIEDRENSVKFMSNIEDQR